MNNEVATERISFVYKESWIGATSLYRKRKFGGFDRIKSVKQLSKNGNTYHFQVVIEYLNGSVENFKDVEVIKGEKQWRGINNEIIGYTKDSF